MSRLAMSGTFRAPNVLPSKADRQRIYDEVTARDKTCRAPTIAAWIADVALVDSRMRMDCSGRLERHHAGITFGANRNRLTDRRHVVLLCQYHHRTWAPANSRAILEYLAMIEGDAK